MQDTDRRTEKQIGRHTGRQTEDRHTKRQKDNRCKHIADTIKQKDK